jgi:hypothetical protein
LSATRFLAKASAVYEETGRPASALDAEHEAQALAGVKAKLEPAAFERAWNEGLALSEDDAIQNSRMVE